ncbi:hypothetical protein BKA70DRAFT_1235871 [Coprinopsis sp. MPI-PUGE-AT-0042]|nr:hypothetical protein BKA70DRAFT_1235871 [Coprinopsis sp. MPI-PUGE-AT-0042]
MAETSCSAISYQPVPAPTHTQPPTSSSYRCMLPTPLDSQRQIPAEIQPNLIPDIHPSPLATMLPPGGRDPDLDSDLQCPLLRPPYKPISGRPRAISCQSSTLPFASSPSSLPSLFECAMVHAIGTSVAESGPVGRRHNVPGTSMCFLALLGVSSGGADGHLAAPPSTPMTASSDLGTKSSESIECMHVTFATSALPNLFLHFDDASFEGEGLQLLHDCTSSPTNSNSPYGSMDGRDIIELEECCSHCYQINGPNVFSQCSLNVSIGTQSSTIPLINVGPFPRLAITSLAPHNKPIGALSGLSDDDTLLVNHLGPRTPSHASPNFLDDPLDIKASGASTFHSARSSFGTRTTTSSSTISNPRSRHTRAWRTDLSTSPSTSAYSFESAPVLEFLEILPELNVPQSRMIGEVYSSHEATDLPTSPSTPAYSFKSVPMLEVLEILPEFNIPQSGSLVNVYSDHGGELTSPSPYPFLATSSKTDMVSTIHAFHDSLSGYPLFANYGKAGKGIPIHALRGQMFLGSSSYSGSFSTTSRPNATGDSYIDTDHLDLFHESVHASLPFHPHIFDSGDVDILSPANHSLHHLTFISTPQAIRRRANSLPVSSISASAQFRHLLEAVGSSRESVVHESWEIVPFMTSKSAGGEFQPFPASLLIINSGKNEATNPMPSFILQHWPNLRSFPIDFPLYLAPETSLPTHLSTSHVPFSHALVGLGSFLKCFLTFNHGSAGGFE